MFAKKKGLKQTDIKDMQSKLLCNITFPKFTRRCRCNMAITYIISKTVDFHSCRLIIQIDQDIPRQPWCEGLAPCILPKGQYWLAYGPIADHRLMSAQELASLQGVGAEELAHFGLRQVPDTLLKDLAGNAFSGPVCMAAVLSRILEWKRF